MTKPRCAAGRWLFWGRWSPIQAAFTACTATAKFLNSTNFGAEVRDATLRSTQVASLTKIQAARFILSCKDEGLIMLEIKVPDFGDFDEVTVIELLVKVSDTIG